MVVLNKTILILEDDLLTLSKLLKRLALLTYKDQPCRFIILGRLIAP